MSQPQEKICPACKHLAPLSAASCTSCGHAFRTQFSPPPVGQTQAFVPPPAPTVYPPPIYPPPDYLPPAYGPSYTREAIQVMPGTHPVWLVVILSLFCVPGLASLVNRQYAKAMVTFFSVFTAIALTIFLFGLGGILLEIAVAWDAIVIANRLNAGEAIGPWQMF